MTIQNPPPRRIPIKYQQNIPEIRDYESRQQETIRLLFDRVSGGTKIVAYSAKTGNYTITASDHLIEVTSGSPTISLPLAGSVTRQEFVIKNSGTGTVTIDGNGTETIDGSLTETLIQKEALTIISNGTNWIVV